MTGAMPGSLAFEIMKTVDAMPKSQRVGEYRKRGSARYAGNKLTPAQEIEVRRLIAIGGRPTGMTAKFKVPTAEIERALAAKPDDL